MPSKILHVVLFKLKEGVTDSQLGELREAGEALVGKVPGLRSWTLGGGLASTAQRAQGYNMAIVSIMDDEESVMAYGPDPLHKEVQKIRLSLCTETIVYDMPIDTERLAK